MPINYARFTINPRSTDEREEISAVDDVAEKFRVHLIALSDQLDAAHVHGAPSKHIQDLVIPWLTEKYRAVSECSDGFGETATIGNRADAQLPVPGYPDRRILVEVERGGPITNNHDLKDLWKTHLSPIAGHLFLIVPNSITNKDGSQRADRAFIQSSARLGGFFTADDRTWVDVLSLHIYGYGPNPLTKAERKALRANARAALRAETT